MFSGINAEISQKMNTLYTMRVDAVLRGRNVRVLIDSGASYNFISSELVERMRWHYDKEDSTEEIIQPNGNHIQIRGLCCDLWLVMGGVSFYVDAYVIDVVTDKVILGVPWLKSVSPLMIDYTTECIRFHYLGEEVEIHGTTAS